MKGGFCMCKERFVFLTVGMVDLLNAQSGQGPVSRCFAWLKLP